MPLRRRQDLRVVIGQRIHPRAHLHGCCQRALAQAKPHMQEVGIRRPSLPHPPPPSRDSPEPLGGGIYPRGSQPLICSHLASGLPYLGEMIKVTRPLPVLRLTSAAPRSLAHEDTTPDR